LSLIKKIEDKISLLKQGVQYSQLSRQTSFAPENALIITGDPRGGTTWLSEIIQTLPNTPIIWEPLWLGKEKTFREIGFSYRQYIPEEEFFLEAHQAFSRLFSGKILNNFLCQFTSPKEIQNADNLLFKFVRANQLLPWLTNQFNFHHPPLYIVRHPCAVVASQIKQGGWEHVKPKFEIPKGPYKEFYLEHEDFISGIDTIEKRMTFVWALTNSVPLEHSGNNIRWVTITYEDLLLEPEHELNRIEKRWGVQFPDAVKNIIQKPSKTTVEGSPILAKKQLEFWKDSLTTRQIDDVFLVLDYFKVKLYSSSPLPLAAFK
jgi:hypothetical protein